MKLILQKIKPFERKPIKEKMNNDHNINEDNDLNGMAPKLSKLSDNNPFNASDDYFDSFTSKLQNRIDDFEEIKDVAPTLLNIDKYNPFEVPADYFEELPGIIQERVIESKNKPVVLEWLLLLLKPRFAFPMIAIIVATVIGINYLNNKVGVKNEAADELSLEDHLYYIDESEIIEQFTADASAEDESVSEEKNNIENYLLDNNIDESNLNNEL